MAVYTKRIETVLGGIAPTEFFASRGQYQAGKSIDPDLPKDDSAVKISGYLRPTSLAKFSASTVTGTPLWIQQNPKDSNIYVYASDGKIHSVSSSLSMNSDVGTPTSGAGNGFAYYDNYMYAATPTTIARYGPLNGSPALTNSYWTSTLSLGALSNTTYPSLRGIPMPNHVMHRHTDDKLYVCDVLSDTTANTNKGCLHFIKTTKTSVEGDTNSGSTYNAIDFDYGEYPTCLETYNTHLAIGLIEGTNTTVLQKPAKISFWDTTSVSFSQITSVELPDPLITALKNVNGVLYAFTGNASGGFRILRFSGGYTYTQVYYSEEGVPPFAGAVDHWLTRIIWGGYTTVPESNAIVYALGSKNSQLPQGVHQIYTATSSDTANQNVTAVKYVLHASNKQPGLIVGWNDDTSQGLDKISTTYGVSTFWSDYERIGKPFSIRSIRIPLAQAVASNMTLTVKVYTDDASGNTIIATINSTNYPNSERNIYIEPATGVSGKHNFFIELRWSGSALLTVALPIIIEYETYDDRT